MTPIYGATKENPYLVDDYPYGFHMRCRIRFWLEEHDSRGFRFVSQTENPKTGRWNAPKPSTYARFGGNMYLDGEGHMAWDGITEYSEAEKAIAFVKAFPESSLGKLKSFASLKAVYYKKVAEKSGKAEDLKSSSDWREVAEACP